MDFVLGDAGQGLFGESTVECAEGPLVDVYIGSIFQAGGSRWAKAIALVIARCSGNPTATGSYNRQIPPSLRNLNGCGDKRLALRP